ncbi:S1C family serine protease [Cryptosporangium aurantiacum]|uniref:Putative serine protease PepD n=1 Tax=Cryptosporangium aurantiacum TaxID=134849 RepID=A0A1M7QPQ4_9ACTN|nr:trypsin-like peptidase domain-containing protein [Cryptosporangium aurantiacum]SHN33521.1 putative serine protease PepD [Cryptosporangium aurantiacum]
MTDASRVDGRPADAPTPEDAAASPPGAPGSGSASGAPWSSPQPDVGYAPTSEAYNTGALPTAPTPSSAPAAPLSGGPSGGMPSGGMPSPGMQSGGVPSQPGPSGYPTAPIPTAGPAVPTPGNGAPGGSPFWSQAGAQDPWRDPSAAPAWLAPTPPGTPPPAGPTPPGDGPARRGGFGPIMLVSIVVAVVAGLLGGALGYVVAARTAGSSFSLGDSSGETPELAERPPTSLAGIAKQLQPSVVTIVIRSASGNGNGSGFVISDEGYVLTNNHVAAPAAAGGTLRVVFHDGTSVSASIVGRDPGSDIAVLKIQKSDLKQVKFGDSDKIAIGDPTVAFGSPLGLADTVTSGIVSALDRPVRTGGDSGASQGDEDDAYLAAIQTDAAINPGNSGGPLVDGAGRVIGVNSAIAALPSRSGSSSGNIGIGFAIPINQAKRIAEEIIATGKARTTIIGAEVNLADETSGGAPLTKVVAGGPAEKAGLKAGDIVTKFVNRPIEDGVALIALIRKQDPNTKVGITYRRGGKTVTTTVTLGQR